MAPFFARVVVLFAAFSALEQVLAASLPSEALPGSINSTATISPVPSAAPSPTEGPSPGASSESEEAGSDFSGSPELLLIFCVLALLLPCLVSLVTYSLSSQREDASGSPIESYSCYVCLNYWYLAYFRGLENFLSLMVMRYLSYALALLCTILNFIALRSKNSDLLVGALIVFILWFGLVVDAVHYEKLVGTNLNFHYFLCLLPLILFASASGLVGHAFEQDEDDKRKASVIGLAFVFLFFLIFFLYLSHSKMLHEIRTGWWGYRPIN